jgi:hypothetical protein
MRPLCAQYVSKPFFCLSDGPTVSPLCARYAPTMRPLYVLTVLGVNRWAHYAPTGISATGWRIAAAHPRDFKRVVTIAKGGSLVEGNLSSLEIEAIALEEFLSTYINRSNMYSTSSNNNDNNNSDHFQ